MSAIGNLAASDQCVLANAEKTEFAVQPVSRLTGPSRTAVHRRWLAPATGTDL